MEAPSEITGGPEYEPLPLLIPCILCSRKFLPESLVRHKKACEKVLMKKRKQFNSAKQRLTGELAECLPLPPAKLKRPSPARKSSRWKEKHLELLETLRAARVGLSSGSLSAPLLSKPADHEQCPHCGRSFGPKAFDRHEEYCREKFARLEHHKPCVSQQARERLEARTKYRAPCVKSRRSITREKYLPASKREPSPNSTTPVVSRAESKPVLTKQSSLSNTKENDAKAASTTGSHFVRSTRNTSSMRSSLRRPSQTKVNPQLLAPKTVNNRNAEPPIRQTLQTLPSNMRIKKDSVSSRDKPEKSNPKQVAYNAFESYQDTDSASACSEAEKSTPGIGSVDDNISDLIDLSSPRLDSGISGSFCDGNIRDIVDPTFTDSSENHTYESVSQNYNKLNLKTLKNPTKSLSSDASSSDSGIGSYDLLSMSGEMRNPSVSNVMDLNFSNYEEKFTDANSFKNLSLPRDEPHFVLKKQKMLDTSLLRGEFPPALKEQRELSITSPLRDEAEVDHPRTPINYVETFQMYKSRERRRSQGTLGGSLEEMVGDNSSNYVRKSHLMKSSQETEPIDRNPRQDFDKLQSERLASFEDSVLDSLATISDVNSADADSIIDKQFVAQDNHVKGFVENASKTTSTVVKNRPNESINVENGRSCASEGSSKMRIPEKKGNHEQGALVNKMDSIKTEQSKKTTKTKKKTPKKSSKAHFENKQELVKSNEKVGKMIPVDGASDKSEISCHKNEGSLVSNDFGEDVSDRPSSITPTPKADPYDSLEEEQQVSNLYDSLNELNSMARKTNNQNFPVFELFSNENYVNDDEISSIADSELIDIADKMNRLSSKTKDFNDPNFDDVVEKRCLDTGKTITSNILQRNDQKKVLPLRNSKKSYNLLTKSNEVNDGIDVVVESVQEIPVHGHLSSIDSNLNIKIAENDSTPSSEECTKKKNSTKMFPPLSKSKQCAPRVAPYKNRPTTANKSLKLPPLKKEPLKPKANEPKRMSTSTCITLPPLNTVKKRGVSRIPKLKNNVTTKQTDTLKKTFPILPRKLNPDKIPSNKSQSMKTSKNNPPTVKQLHTFSKGLEAMEDSKASANVKNSEEIKDLGIIEKTPKIVSDNLIEKEIEFATVISPGEMEDVNTNNVNICAVPVCEDELSLSREDIYDPFASAEKQMKELLSFSLKTEKIEPPSPSAKPLLLKALPLPYHDSPKSPKISSEHDTSQNRSICSIDSVLSKSGSQNSLDQSIASLESFLDNSMLDTSAMDYILDQRNGNTPGKTSAKASRTKSVDYAQSTPLMKDYVRSKSVTTPDPSLTVAMNFEQLQKSLAHSKESLSKSATQSRESLTNKSVTQSRESLTKSMTQSRESLSKSASSGSKRSTLNSPDLIDRPGSRTSLSHASHDSGRKSSLSMHDDKNSNIPDGKHIRNEGNRHVDSGETVPSGKCSSPFDQMRHSSATPASLDTILGRKNSLDEFTTAELLSRLSAKNSANSSRKSSVCSDCSQVMSRKNSSSGFLPDIARCGAKETPLPRDCERNINRASNTSVISGEDTGYQGRIIRSAGGAEPLRRSASLFEPAERHPARSKSRGKMSCDETTSLPKLDMNRNQDVHHRPVAGLDDLDLVEAELLQSVSEFEKIFDLSSSSSLYSSPYANSTMHEDARLGEGKVQNTRSGGGSKTSGDSAYNSLNRKTDHTSSNSSSGSESSFPNSNGAKPSKFCHECGTQYPLVSAKFCCQCGVRRLCLA